MLGKSFLTAVFIVIKCILWPGTKCVIACKVRTQSINILDEKIMKELVPLSPLLRSEIAKVDINNQKAEIIFKNTSYVKVEPQQIMRVVRVRTLCWSMNIGRWMKISLIWFLKSS